MFGHLLRTLLEFCSLEFQFATAVRHGRFHLYGHLMSMIQVGLLTLDHASVRIKSHLRGLHVIHQVENALLLLLKLNVLNE